MACVNSIGPILNRFKARFVSFLEVMLAAKCNTGSGRQLALQFHQFRQTRKITDMISPLQKNFTSRTFQFTTNILRLLLLVSAGYTKNPLCLGLYACVVPTIFSPSKKVTSTFLPGFPSSTFFDSLYLLSPLKSFTKNSAFSSFKPISTLFC